MRIINSSKQSVLAEDGKIADTFFSRMKGLLGKDDFLSGEGLIITRCQSIHMVFMAFAIDAIFINKDKEVVGLVRNIKPYAFSRIYMKASCVIELPVGTIDSTRTEIRDVISW